MWLPAPDIGHLNGIWLVRSDRQRHTATTSMLIIAFIACFHIITTNGQQKGDEVCETLPSEIHLIKGISIASHSKHFLISSFPYYKIRLNLFIHSAQFN